MTTATTAQWRAFPLNRLRLLPGRWNDSQQAVKRYLLTDDLAPRLLRQWHLVAGLDSYVKPIGGPERPDLGSYRGDFLGHYMSATAMMFAATGDAALRERGEYVVGEVAKCQEALNGDGFVAGFPQTRLDAVERGMFVMVPYYALHKIMAGLLDQHALCGSAQALEVLVKLAGHINRRIDRLGMDHWRKIVLPIEYGGMLELGLDLHAVTGDPAHMDLAMKFDERAFFDPLAQGEDNLTDRHANTNIPKIVSAARAYEVTGDARWLAIATNFWRMFTTRRMYVCGGSDHAEMWFDPALMPRSLSRQNHEFCCVHNMIKLSRYLFRLTGEARYADYIERATVNTVLGTIRPSDGMIGSSLLSMTTGCRRIFSMPYESFWCCMGTGIESAADLAHDAFCLDATGDTLTVNLAVPVRAEWPERGVTVEQQTDFPDSDCARLTVRAARPQRFAVRLRVPYWASGARVAVNGKPVKTPAGDQPDTQYVVIEREWRDGDTVELTTPMRLRTEALYGDDDVRAVCRGPVVLAGAVREDRFVHPACEADRLPAPTPGVSVADWFITGDPAKIEEWLVPAEAPMTFRTSGVNADLAFVPFNTVIDQPYGVYWPMLQAGSPRLAATLAGRDAMRQREGRVVDRVRIGDESCEAAHRLQAGGSSLVWHAGWASRNGGESFAWTLKALPDRPMSLLASWFASDGGWRGFEIRVDGEKLEGFGFDRMPPCEFHEKELPIPEPLTRGKTEVVVSFHSPDPEGRINIGPIFGVATLRRVVV